MLFHTSRTPHPSYLAEPPHARTREVEGAQAASPTRARVLALILAAAAITAAMNLLLRPVPAELWLDHAAVSTVRGAAWVFGLTAGMATGVAFASLGLAVCMLVHHRGRTLATSGAVLMGVGGVAYACGFFASTAVAWYATSPALDSVAGAALLEHVDADSLRAFGPQIAGFLSSVVGFVLVSVALWRSRTVPRWLPSLMPTTVVLSILAGSGLAFDVLHAFFLGTFVLVAGFLWIRTSQPEPA